MHDAEFASAYKNAFKIDFVPLATDSAIFLLFTCSSSLQIVIDLHTPHNIHFFSQVEPHSANSIITIQFGKKTLF